MDMTQPLWENMLTDVDDLHVSTYPSVRLNFAHLSTIMPLLRFFLLYTYTNKGHIMIVVILLLRAFGLYQDLGLKASDWPARNRKWKTSQIGAFASNLAVYVVHCNRTSVEKSNQRELPRGDSREERESSEEDSSEENSSEEDSSEEDSSKEDSSKEDPSGDDSEEFSSTEGPDVEDGWQVVVFHQEKPVALEVCGGGTLCPLGDFLQVGVLILLDNLN